MLDDEKTGGDSPERVALDLVKFIAQTEGQSAERGGKPIDSRWVLSMYRDALSIVRGGQTDRERKIMERAAAKPQGGDQSASSYQRQDY